MRPQDMTLDEYVNPVLRDERDVALWQSGYLAGVAEGVRIGREQIVAERLAQQAAHAEAHPFPADQKVKSLRAKRAREQSPADRRAAA